MGNHDYQHFDFPSWASSLLDPTRDLEMDSGIKYAELSTWTGISKATFTCDKSPLQLRSKFDVVTSGGVESSGIRLIQDVPGTQMTLVLEGCLAPK